MLARINNAYLVSVPDKGGELVEGIVGSSRFINPVLAISDADKDMSSLVYAGLMRAQSDGTLAPDVAERYEISEDGRTYRFFVRTDALFHDGTPVTAQDVEFTVLKIQDASIKSPKRANWEGIVVSVVNDKEIVFTLEKPYGPFLENATLGILPKHVWQNATADEFTFSEYNISPVGSGPYKVTNVERNSVGVPSVYKLRSFTSYSGNEPYITHLTIRFYPSELDLVKALESGDVESASGLSPNLVSSLSDNTRIETTVLPRVFGVFFNQNQSALFTNKEVREALDAVIDKNAIVRNVLESYGTGINGPIPPLTSQSLKGEESAEEKAERITKARALLTDGGWKQNQEGIWQKSVKNEVQTLTFTLTTGNAPELKSTANMIAADWKEIGIIADVAIYETGDLNQNIIRPRKYDALLFGEIIGRDLDLFPFWHSSQRLDPGLNIAMYANPNADKLLEEARSTTDTELRKQKYSEFESEILNNAPAIFLYSPSFIYILPKKVENVTLGQLTFPGERFSNIKEWYIEKNKVWKIFTKS